MSNMSNITNITARNHRKPWTEDEEYYFMARWGTMPDKELRKKLGRTQRALEAKASNLHCRRNSKFGPHPYHQCPQCGVQLNGAYYKSNDTAATVLYMCPVAIGEQVKQYGVRVLPREAVHSAIVFYVEWKGVLEVFREDNRVIKEQARERIAA